MIRVADQGLEVVAKVRLPSPQTVSHTHSVALILILLPDGEDRERWFRLPVGER